MNRWTSIIVAAVAGSVLACGNGGNAARSDGGGAGAGGTGLAGSGATGGTAGTGGLGAGGSGATVQTSVLEHHGNRSRDGVFIDPALTKTAAATLHVDTSFANATISGPTFAQPLYLAGTAGGPDLVIAATEQNQIYAFNATNGALVWNYTLGTPVDRAQLPCGNITPVGVTGTPIIDATTRTLYVDGLTTPDGGTTKRHLVFALDATSGNPRPGWPVDLNALAQFDGLTFDSSVQGQRGALALLGGSLYVPFGGFYGDCGGYHGWVVGIATANPTQVSAWATAATGGGIWGPGGISSDGTSLYFATGNTFLPTTWQGGEGLFKLPPSLAFNGLSTSYFTPTNWPHLDTLDLDLGGTAPVVLDVPGATPSNLLIALGKDGYAYLIDRANLGGMTAPVASLSVSDYSIINATVAYTTSTGTYVVFAGAPGHCPAGQTGGLTALKIAATSPPSISVAWCAGIAVQGSPSVSMTDPQGSNTIVWFVGSDLNLHGHDGDTGQEVVNGGALSLVQIRETPIVVKGRIFVAASDQVFAFTTH